MAITFESVAAPGASPIANNSASAKSFANNYAKLKTPGVSTRERKAIIIIGMMWVLGETTAFDYRSNHAGLIQDSEVYTKGISHFDVFAALAATSVSAGFAAKGTFPMTLDALELEGRDLIDLHEDTLDRIIGFLGAQLGL